MKEEDEKYLNNDKEIGLMDVFYQSLKDGIY